MNEFQILDIRNYLLSKNLPVDLLMEVEDHFVAHVNDLCQTKAMCFEDAFAKVKEFWKEDLTESYYYNGKSTTQFVKEIKTRQLNEILLSSFIATASLVFLLYLLAFSVSNEIFTEVLPCIIIIFLSIAGMHYLINFNVFRFSKNNPKIRLNIYQNGNILVFFAGFATIVLGNTYNALSERIHNFLTGNFSVGFASFLILLITIWFYSFGFLMQMRFVKSAKKTMKMMKFSKLSF